MVSPQQDKLAKPRGRHTGIVLLSRVIYRIDLGRHCVEIVAIEHRSDAYRSR